MKIDNLDLPINKMFSLRHFIYHNALFYSILNENKLINRNELEKEIQYVIASNPQEVIWEVVKGDNGEYFRTIGMETPRYVAVISQEEWQKRYKQFERIIKS